eukprot:symbB.v1.2.014530.t1/scaffold1031.1/size143042/5
MWWDELESGIWRKASAVSTGKAEAKSLGDVTQTSPDGGKSDNDKSKEAKQLSAIARIKDLPLAALKKAHSEIP